MFKKLLLSIGLAFALSSAAFAQNNISQLRIPDSSASGYHNAPAAGIDDGLGADLKVTCANCSLGKQESFALATGNVASAPVIVYGGDYIFSQTASAYGTIALQSLGPDGATYQTLVSKTTTDTAGGTGITFGGNATVKVVLTGTTGATVTLTRVP